MVYSSVFDMWWEQVVEICINKGIAPMLDDTFDKGHFYETYFADDYSPEEAVDEELSYWGD